MAEQINIIRLKSLGACPDQVQTFRRLFGDADAPLSVEVAVEHASEFNWGWAAKNLLSPSRQAVYDDAIVPIGRAYSNAMEDARRTYSASTAAMRVQYEAAAREPRESFEAATAPIYQAYERTVGLFREQYQEIVRNMYQTYLKSDEYIPSEHVEAKSALLKSYNDSDFVMRDMWAIKIAPLTAARDQAVSSFRQAHEQTLAPVGEAYRNSIEPASKVYYAAASDHKKTHDEATARLFARLYLAQ